MSALRRTLLLLAVLGAPLLASAACSGFQCKSGECLYLVQKCNGDVECKDGSDELPGVCRQNTVILPERKNLTIRVDFERQHGYVEFHLCNATACGHIDVYGVEPDNRFSVIFASGCNASGRKCTLDQSKLRDADFQTGRLEFVVQRSRQGRFALWTPQHPERAVKVDVHPDSDRLQVLPGLFEKDMRVQFFDATGTEVPKLPAA